MTIDYDAIRTRAEAAEPGPWQYEDGQLTVAAPEVLIGLEVLSCCNLDDATMTFIAHAREDVPALLDEIERQREALERLRDVLVECIDWLDSRPDYTEGDAATSSAARAALEGRS